MKLVKLNSTDRHKLNSFVSKNDRSQFLQSFYWQNIVKLENKETNILAVVDSDNNYLLSSLLITEKNRFVSYYYCPRGPIVCQELLQDKDRLKKVIFFWEKEVQKVLNKEASFIRIEPDFHYESRFKKEKTLAIQAEKTLLTDLSQSKEEILKNMHQKTRYNIRLSQKRGVEVKEGRDKKDIDKFWKLLNTTGERNNFGLHSKDHYEKIIKGGDDKVSLLLAYHGDEVLAGGLFSFFGDQAVYLHGASSSSKRNLMAPQALQWEAILKSKERGLKYYDFGGISEKLWPGVTRFKLGFSDLKYNYPGTFDLILNEKKYLIYKFIRKIRRKLRF